MFKKKSKEKGAIAVNRTYNGFKRPTQYKVHSGEKCCNIVKQMVSDTDSFASYFQKEDKLPVPPKLKLNMPDNKSVPGQPDIMVFLEVNLTYNTTYRNGGLGTSDKFIIGSIIWLIFMAVFMAFFWTEQQKTVRYKNLCRVFTTDGQPTKVIYQGREVEVSDEFNLADVDSILFGNKNNRTSTLADDCLILERTTK